MVRQARCCSASGLRVVSGLSYWVCAGRVRFLSLLVAGLLERCGGPVDLRAWATGWICMEGVAVGWCARVEEFETGKMLIGVFECRVAISRDVVCAEEVADDSVAGAWRVGWVGIL